MTPETIKRHISAGVYDNDLTEITDAIKERLMTIRNARTTSDFGLGDRVMFNDHCGIPNLRGQPAAVIGLSSTRVAVKLENPVGNYARYVDGKWIGGEMRTLPNAIDPMV